MTTMLLDADDCQLLLDALYCYKATLEPGDYKRHLIDRKIGLLQRRLREFNGLERRK